ncbi:MAG: VCBS repeat-containing protein, partial [Bacteroidetes bacterium]|nr:VCBS repeat-containing protein [Bacteroidota bacterium]
GIGADNETPGSALTYNLRVGTTSGGSEILKPAIGEQFMEEFAAAKAQANNPSSFYSLLPEAGNAGQNQFAKLNRLAPGTYYWSAQSVDNSYNLSDFSTEQTFEVVTPLAPLAPTGLSSWSDADSVVLSWNPNSETNIDYYRIFSATDVDTVFVGRTDSIETSFSIQGLVQGEFKNYYVTAVSADELESEFSIGILAGLKLFATQSFSQFGTSYRNNFAIGDFDGDGLNDVINYDSNPSLNLHRNLGLDVETGDWVFDSGNSLGFIASYNGAVEAADFNNDGRLDVAISNDDGISIYRNEGPGEVGVSFIEIYNYAVIPNNLSLVWADTNNDGDQDLIGSRNDSGYVFILHNMLNDSASEVPFEYESIQVPGTTEGSLDVADFDHDGDQDILITGFASDGSDWETRLNAIYVNNGPDSAWTVQSQEFSGSFKGQGSWGDFNADGYSDFISIGSIGDGGREVHLYENNQDSTFSEVTTSFTGLAASSAVWGDLNKDGYPDLVLSGVSGSLDNGDSRTMEVWFNNAGEGFTQAPEYFEGMTFGGIILSDIDGDNDLDIVTLGSRDYFGGGGGEALTYNQGTNFQIHFNRIAGSSVAPDAPVSVSVADIVNNSVTLSWSAGSDENTPVAGLTYNVRLYNSILEKEFVSTLSNPQTGERMMAGLPNAGSALKYSINNLPDGDYEWYVQTVNNEFNGSAWIAGTPFSVTYTVPVELAEFRSSQKADVVNLFWSTRSETNNYGFEVQKSEVNAGTKEWKTVGFVKGSGTTVETQSYQFAEKIGKTAVSYRLRQLDLDGKESYSQILVVEPQLPTVFAMEQNYPNPFNPVTNIPISIPVAGQVSMKVFDILGREVATLLNEKREAGFYTVQFDGAKLSSGVYFVRLESAGKAAIKKLTLLK